MHCLDPWCFPLPKACQLRGHFMIRFDCVLQLTHHVRKGIIDPQPCSTCPNIILPRTNSKHQTLMNQEHSGALFSFEEKKHIEVGKEIQERQGFSPITELTIFKYWPYWRVGCWGEGPRNAKIGPQKIYLTIKQLGILKWLSILKYRECGYG